MKTVPIPFLAIALLVSIPWTGACSSEESCQECDAGTCALPDRKSPDAGVLPTVSDIGDICAHDTDCKERCLLGLSGMAPYCTRSCVEEPCPAGYLCLSHDQAGMVCTMAPCTVDEDCPDDYTCNTEDPENPVCRHADIGCDNDADCPAATACNQGLCELLCEGDDDCKQGYHCHWHRRCVQCTASAHCENDFSCEDGNCNKACIDNGDCRLGFSCGKGECDVVVGGGSIEMGRGDDDAGCDEDGDCQDFCYEGSCTRTCQGEEDVTSCPEGYSCHSGILICQRSGGR